MEDMADDTYEQAVKRQRKRLWIDKYNSRNFLDLMSDDLSNRRCLTWMKSWDDVVFDKHQNITAPNIKFKKTNFFKDFTRPMARKMNFEEECSRLNKPLLMLHGNPGTGKSTMAKVIANMCGYEAKHVNASDLRNGD